MIANPAKLYMLRHEQRGESAAFDSRLTAEGLLNAQTKILELLADKEIQSIYCSPFPRTLETIRPWCEENNLRVNVEWSLAESIPPNADVPCEFRDIMNLNYNSFLNPYTAPEVNDFNDLKRQVSRFLEVTDRTKHLLFVTHMPVMNAILSLYGNYHVSMYTPHSSGTLLTLDRSIF